MEILIKVQQMGVILNEPQLTFLHQGNWILSLILLK